MHRSLLLPLVLSFCVIACTPPSVQKPATTPISLPTVIPAGGMVSITLPSRGTPEAFATLEIFSQIVDITTGAPVAADVYVLSDQELREPLPDELLASQVLAFRLTLPSKLSGRLLVRAPGYRDWDVRLEYNVKTSRVLEGPVEMIRLSGEDL